MSNANVPYFVGSSSVERTGQGRNHVKSREITLFHGVCVFVYRTRTENHVKSRVFTPFTPT